MSDRQMLEVKSRRAWGALDSWQHVALVRPATRVFYTTTESDQCHDNLACIKQAQLTELTHRQRGLPDVRYSFMIGGDCKAYEGRGWTWEPLLPRKYREYCNTTIFIGFIGRFVEDDVPYSMMKTAHELVDFGIQHQHIDVKYTPMHLFPWGFKYNTLETLDAKFKLRGLTDNLTL